MKKKISSFMVVVVMLLLFSQIAYAAEDNKEYSAGHFFYHSHEGYVSISGYLGRETEITIPSNISGKPVSEIEAKAFDGCDTIQTVTVPDTVVIVHGDSFTGAVSLKKIISHTVGVKIQADSGVKITYTAEEENKKKDKTGTDSKDKDSSENKNPADKTDTDKKTGSDKKADPDIGDYAYEENGTGMDDNDSSKSNTNHQTTSQTGENPQGVQIPGTDNVVITTDDKGNLVKIDSTGNQTKIDDAHTYTLTEADDGTVKITDESGEEVVVDEDGTLILPSGKTVTLTDDTVTTETEEESGHWFGLIVVAGIFVILAVAVIVLYRKRKKI